MAIVKKAKNINIQVANNYTSLCKVSYEESEEVIMEATKGNLNLSSQKRVIMQGFGKESEKEEASNDDSESDWMTQSMNIKADKPQTGETDCVPTVGRAAGKYLGMDIDAKDKQKEANKIGGVKGNKTKEFFESMGLKVETLHEGARNYYFHNGIPNNKNKEAIQFIVESLQAQHPVYIGFSSSETGQNMGHAVLVTKIKYKDDFSKFKFINYYDPNTGSDSGQLVSFQNTYGYSQTIYNIFSLLKP